jgi:flagellar biosynthesis/type III secretory pathway protein FliH
VSGGERAGTILSSAVFDAKAEAQRILAEAREQAQALFAQARAQGFEEGRTAGQAAAATELVAKTTELARARAAAQADLARLAVRIAEKILARALALDPALVVDLCAAALAGLAGDRSIVLRVHPEDVALVEAARERLRGVGAAGELAVRSDPTIGRGGCVVESELGRVDGRLEAQLAAIERGLRVAAPR